MIGNCSFAVKYSEDNAAYWYQKAFNVLKTKYMAQDLPQNDKSIIYKLNNLEDFNKLSPETKKILENSLKGFLTDLKKAKSLEKCLFWKMPLNDKDEKKTQFEDFKMIYDGFRMGNALAWYAISIKKPDIAGAIWQTMLNISIKISEHNLIDSKIIPGGTTINIVIPSLNNYCAKDASSEFKTKFVHYLKKWPKSIFNMSDSIKIDYEYQKNNVELYAKDQKFLACFFGANLKNLISDTQPAKETVVKENRECLTQRRVIGGALEMYAMDNEEGAAKAANLEWDEVVSLMLKERYIKESNFTCPENGKRTITPEKKGDDVEYKITCSCTTSSQKNPMDNFKPDSQPMKLAKKYKDTQFENDKKQLFEYYEMLLKVDHTKPMNEKEMLALNCVEMPKYKNNVLLMRLGLAYNSIRKSFDGYQKLIDDFIKKYE